MGIALYEQDRAFKDMIVACDPDGHGPKAIAIDDGLRPRLCENGAATAATLPPAARRGESQ
jgi:hypothetical protein